MLMRFEDYEYTYEDEIADRAEDEGITFAEAAELKYREYTDNSLEWFAEDAA